MSEGERILYFRTKQKKSRRELSGLSGVSESAIKQYETGKRQPKTEQLKRIADALGVNVGVLLYGENFMTIDSDGVKYYGPYIPKDGIDKDDIFEYKTVIPQEADTIARISYNLARMFASGEMDNTELAKLLDTNSLKSDEDLRDTLSEFLIGIMKLSKNERNHIMQTINLLLEVKGAEGEGGDDK